MVSNRDYSGTVVSRGWVSRRIILSLMRAAILLFAFLLSCARPLEIDPRDLPGGGLSNPNTGGTSIGTTSSSSGTGTTSNTVAPNSCQLGGILFHAGQTLTRYYPAARADGNTCGYATVTCNSDLSYDFDNYGYLDTSLYPNPDPAATFSPLRNFTNHYVVVTGQNPVDDAELNLVIQYSQASCP
jgi:hypothetical protein